MDLYSVMLLEVVVMDSIRNENIYSIVYLDLV